MARRWAWFLQASSSKRIAILHYRLCLLERRFTQFRPRQKIRWSPPKSMGWLGFLPRRAIRSPRPRIIAAMPRWRIHARARSNYGNSLEPEHVRLPVAERLVSRGFEHVSCCLVGLERVN
jgi:hypothetical protein